MSIRTYFENIATAIKQKNSEIVTVTPAQMPQAILDIPTGGGGIQLVEPLHVNFNNGYIYSGTFYWDSSSNPPYVNDCYLLESGHKYLFSLGNTLGDRMRCILAPKDPYGLTEDVHGASVGSDVSNPTFFNSVQKFQVSNYPYFVVNKSSNRQTNINTYVIDITEWS